ncbi:sigma factor-like helix-turn-helix DNA-binding protein [Jeotgalibacillus proteolyticus]|uniref:RNA polymerase subunit sigma n=1 Tax=Jeotgalibacillus proteolyticus TaxID=2082395 RepID=A0A2S5GDU1_9BACL|nr:sigma factor-like helix-turn-helix DNA-binding protein [Jeotgalibacillus proteolyticus]PPA71081.1 RNA polymerase subunit sigma [Jeotgalibacillus proteolyticus]
MRAKGTMMKKAEGERVEELLVKLQSYCSWLAKNRWDSEEITQEAFAKALKTYKPTEWTAPLLKKIAYHVWVDRIRKTERETFKVVDHATHQVFFKGEELIHDLSKKMTPKQLVTFVLKEGFNYQISEIAELLGMTEPGVKALLNRARARLKSESESDREAFWEEELQEELFPVLIDAVSSQDPEKLLAMLPAVFTPVQKSPVSRFSSFYALSRAA